MKVTNLMVGDWVICNHYQDKPFTKQFGVGDFAKGEYEFCEPIPLTEEILVKNGFEKLNDETFLLKNQIEIEVGPKFSEVSARYEDYDRDYNSYNNNYIEIAIIHYVHQLQHLLRLCGIEKEITI